MHIAWSLNELTNFGPMSLSSLALAAHTSTACLSGSRRAFTERIFGRPALRPLIVISALLLSTTSFASASIDSSGSVHLSSADACACALALHSADAFTSAWPSQSPWQVPLHSPLHSPPEPPVPALPAQLPSHLPWQVPLHVAPTSADALPSHSAANFASASTLSLQTAGLYLILRPALPLKATFMLSLMRP